MTDHCGRALPLLADFFVPAPPEIGEILSAYTSLKFGVKPLSKVIRTALILGLAGGGPLLGFWLGSLTKVMVPILIIGIIAGAIAALIAFYVTRFAHRCSYVGREGIARFLCVGNRGTIDGRVLRFRDATELRVTKTLRYSNRKLQGLDYSFTWTDASGRAVYRIAGTYNSAAANAVSSDSYHFATAAEVAWSNYRLRQIWPSFLSGETIGFSLGGLDWVRLGQGQLVVRFQRETIHCAVRDIAEVRIENGWFEVLRKDAPHGWSSSSGIFKFPSSNLGNAQLFLFLVDSLIGSRK